uniref:Uncharacterized protein n=1 Tax=Avena sativa TaxID=4498 RepID=A0ACD6AUB5_AVESA
MSIRITWNSEERFFKSCRCESVLQPGFNCTIRIKNNRKKAKRRKKSNSGQNCVVYACHFCGDQNLIRGSGKGIVKGLLSSRKSDITNIMDNKHSNGPKSDLPEDSKIEKGAVFPTMDCHELAAATVQEDISLKTEVESATHDKCMNEIKPVSDITSQEEFLVGSNFVTPQKNKLGTVPKGSAEPLKTRSTLNNKGQGCVSVAGKAPRSYSKSASKTNSAPSDSTQPTGSSRKRTRKGWTTLKQIAEKDELERKEKMDNFVIPFFMQ